MENEANVQVVQFWFIVKTMILKLQAAREAAVEAFIQQLAADPATAKGDPSIGAGWKTKLDALVKPFDDQLASLTSVLATTAELIQYLFLKFEEQVEAAIRHVKQGAHKELQGQEHELDQFWSYLESQKPHKGKKAD